MTDTPVKLCPFISTAQVVPNEVVVQGTSTAQPRINLQSIQGIGGASSPETSVVALRGGFGYKTRLPEDMAKKLNMGQMSIKDVPPELIKAIPDALSVPCTKGSCARFCEVHDDCKVGGCTECQLKIMTMAFSAALESHDAPKG